MTGPIPAKGHMPFPVVGYTATNYENNPAAWPVTRVRTYRMNDWIMPIPASHAWTAGDVVAKPQAQFHRLRDGARMVLAGECYSKNLVTNFDALYYNPKHGNNGLTVNADGHVHNHPSHSAGGAGILWSPNHGVSSSYPVDCWGTYLHPDYTAQW